MGSTWTARSAQREGERRRRHVWRANDRVEGDRLPAGGRRLGYVGRLLDARTTLAEYRRLLVVGGWLSRLAATTPIDLHRDHAAASEHLRTAAQFARETAHAEIAAWVHGKPPRNLIRQRLHQLVARAEAGRSGP